MARGRAGVCGTAHVGSGAVTRTPGFCWRTFGIVCHSRESVQSPPAKPYEPAMVGIGTIWLERNCHPPISTWSTIGQMEGGIGSTPCSEVEKCTWSRDGAHHLPFFSPTNIFGGGTLGRFSSTFRLVLVHIGRGVLFWVFLVHFCFFSYILGFLGCTFWVIMGQRVVHT